jgi:hypothetical protein
LTLLPELLERLRLDFPRERDFDDLMFLLSSLFIAAFVSPVSRLLRSTKPGSRYFCLHFLAVVKRDHQQVSTALTAVEQPRPTPGNKGKATILYIMSGI